MRITIIQAGEVPPPLRERFGAYPPMFERMFALTGGDFTYETVAIAEGAPLPDAAGLDAIVITGSSAGVYDDDDWIAPLRGFVRAAYGAGTPMVGICFGHQIMADALGGDVRKSEKGWGLGRHSYRIMPGAAALAGLGGTLAVACSHQDQVLVPPAMADTILASDFTPHAGLAYRNGRALSFQPHPEFEDAYAGALAELRRGRAPDAVIEAALASFDTPSDSAALAGAIARFLKG